MGIGPPFFTIKLTEPTAEQTAEMQKWLTDCAWIMIGYSPLLQKWQKEYEADHATN